MTEMFPDEFEDTEGDFSKEDLIMLHEDLADFEACLELNGVAGKTVSSVIDAVQEVMEAIEGMVKKMP